MTAKPLLALPAVLLAGALIASISLAQPASPDARTEFPGATLEQGVVLRLPTGVRLPTGPAEWSTLIGDDFEGAFPGATWSAFGTPTWGRTTYRKHGGNASVYAVGGGTGAVPPPGPYPNGVNAWMIRGPVSLADATGAELTFYHWTNTENSSSTKRDRFCAVASADGADFTGTCFVGNWTTRPEAVNGWITGTLDLAALNLLGDPSVWIAFTFTSDDSVTREGTYLDDVLLRIWCGATPTPTPTATPRPACPGANRANFVTLEDNENNALSGTADGDLYPPQLCLFRNDPLLPIEFRIVADPLPPTVTQALLSLFVWDVDEQNSDCPEVDKVFLNGAEVGTLTGANDVWSTTALAVNPALVRQGSNLVQVTVNTRNCPRTDDPTRPDGRWCTGINWGQLALGAAGPAAIRSITPARTCYWPGSAAVVEVEADTTLASQAVRVEVNLLATNQNNLAGAAQEKTIHGAENDAFRFALPISSTAVRGDYVIQVIVYDTCSETQNAYRTIPLRIDPGCGHYLPLMLHQSQGRQLAPGLR